MNGDEDDIGGVHIKYLLHCHRQLWLYSRGYRPESRNEDVAFGESVNDTTYRRHHEVDLGAAKIDWVTVGAIVHETKSSRRPSPQHDAQALHYCLLLARRSITVRGAHVHYPLIRRTTKLAWDTAARRSAEATEEHARRVIAAATPAARLPRSSCRGCSYLDYCWGES
ncbi:MAG: CRISPR-associated protein Cas4 [Micromonosporaceae bacterium]|nr:CRISPR-associated protein Cas4 [Micromonosporaceae bacterium]